MAFSLPSSRSVAVNPTQMEMRAWVLEHMARLSKEDFGENAPHFDADGRIAPPDQTHHTD